ncbi:zinc-binding alcohol dehydrogenase family protein KNAG_0I02490 [Huiozyma naganishii CBS 8797]|uniref:Enoyl reductase (ER) domain-containing protein n=1 Tax=Huiozyma naganishii (strain ATCC MYA-139 / BCRC 22969 / CBS 8797 / KCTC 17520 / NBRC 10181 / NCYC 3082 / Yp74L-3) TaxID=1071383 RepID=J7RAZ1_HUIN7|nr:hypothetical protein KNAG_0I02490 [Kazachstania naganishii CBS 8797]CCK72035.1 hypothetical protein KNAG_0I02490 [Kazachstania naganishii CBS 8797]
MFETGIPKTMRAVVIEGDKAVVKDGVPVPLLDDGFMLIKVCAVAVNPMDWKHVEFKMGSEGAILGCDVAGQVLSIGSSVSATDFRVGDYVCSFIHGGSTKRHMNGAFAEYAAVDASLTYCLPQGIKAAPNSEDSLPEGPVDTVEGAASLPVGLTTSGGVLVHELRLALDWEPEKPQKDTPLLVWGGATSVGQVLIQVAKKLHGFTKIIAVASKKHEKQLREYGADEVYDYHDKDVVQQIQERHNDIQVLVDVVSSEQTIQQVYRCASRDKPATVVQLEFLNIEQIHPEDRRDDVKIIGTLIYLSAGWDVPIGPYHFPPNPQYRKEMISFVKFIDEKVKSGEIHHIPVKINRNGLEDIPALMEQIKQGKNSGEKFVTVLE